MSWQALVCKRTSSAKNRMCAVLNKSAKQKAQVLVSVNKFLQLYTEIIQCT
jgi:hypothetical protein